MNLPGVLRHCTRLAHALAAGVAVVAMLAAPLTVYANDTTDTTDSSDTTDATGNQTENQPKQSIAITQSTPIVTSKSGYRVTAVISNTDSTATSSGTLHLTTNALFTFVSRTDIQNWAENNAPIPTPNELGSVDVPSIPAGGTATVTIEVNANQQTLASIGSWGPKPLMLSYIVGNQILADLPSFLTRSSDGLKLMEIQMICVDGCNVTIQMIC